MKIKSIVLLAVALGCGLVAMLGVQQILSGDKAQAADGTSQVLVATAEIMPGVLLNETNTTFKEVSHETVAEGIYVTDPEEFKDRALQGKAFPGEMIMLSKLTEPGGGGISAGIPDRMRIVTVKCDATMIASGMIRPGDRVDVMVTYKSQGPDRQTLSKTRTVLEFIEVFATDSVREVNEADATGVKAKNISFLVTPEQAQVLKMAEDKGSLHLSLRKKTDKEEVNAASFSEKDLDEGTPDSFGKENPDEGAIAEAGTVREFVAQEQQQTVAVEPESEKSNKWTIHVYSGREHREEQVDLPEEPAAAAAAERPLSAWLNKLIKGS